MNEPFEERQRVVTNPLSWVVLPLSLYMWYEMGVFVVTGSPSAPTPGNAPISPWGLTLLFLFVGVLIPAWLFSMQLRTRVANDMLEARFWPFANDRIAYSHIRSATPIEYQPIGDCMGWGIRRYRAGRALTVRGRQGVLVTYERDGRTRTLLIGSQRAKALADAISARASAGPPQSSRGSTRA